MREKEDFSVKKDVKCIKECKKIIFSIVGVIIFASILIIMKFWLSPFCEWIHNLSGTDYVDFAMLILTIVGGAFALIQWRKANRTRSAEFINSLVEKVRNDKEISDIMYMFDYGYYKWYRKSFHKSKLERKVDKTLSFYSYICYLKKNKLISKKDFEFFEYQIVRIAHNRSVQEYFFNIYNFSEKQGTKMSSCYLFDYCYENKLFGEGTDEIKNPNSKYYPKYLYF